MILPAGTGREIAFVARVVAETGRLDVSFNVAARGDVHGTPLLEMPAADFVTSVVRGITGSRAGGAT